MANKVLEFQKQLLTDEAARKAFAANPGKFLEQHGIKLPANVKAPSTIPISELEAQVKNVKEALSEQSLTLEELPINDPPAMTRFIEEAIPLRTSDLRLSTALHSNLAKGGDVATVAAIGAVVVAVVAVPVGVFGRTARGIDEIVKGVEGLSGITRVGNTFTLHTPTGVRVEGLDTSAVVNVIKGLR